MTTSTLIDRTAALAELPARFTLEQPTQVQLLAEVARQLALVTQLLPSLKSNLISTTDATNLVRILGRIENKLATVQVLTS